jgi:YaiO family outer membrane protein
VPAAANFAFTVVLTFVALASLFPMPVCAGEVDDLYRGGVAARLDQRFEAAVDLLSRAAQLQPENADIWVQLGFARSAAGQLDEARAAFEQAVLLAPGYVDAHLGLARLAFWRGDLDEAGQRLATVRRLDPGNEEAALVAQQVADARAVSHRVWRLDMGASASDLSDALPGWREGTVSLSRRVNTEMTVAAAVRSAERFGAADSYFEGRIDYRFDQKIRAWLFAGATPSADFLPQSALGIGASAKIGEDGEGFGPAVLSGEIANFHYSDDDVTRINPALQIYLFKGRAWMSVQGIATFSAKAGWSGGYVARGDIKLDDRLRIFAGYGDAPDLSNGETIASRSMFGGIAIALSDRVSAVLSLTRTELDGAYSRNEAGLAIGVAF